MIKLQKNEALDWYAALSDTLKESASKPPDHGFESGFANLRKQMEGIYANLVKYDKPEPGLNVFDHMSRVWKGVRRTDFAKPYDQLEGQLHNLRKICNKASHYCDPPFHAEQAEFYTGVWLLAQLVKLFGQSDPKMPPALAEELAGVRIVTLDFKNTGGRSRKSGPKSWQPKAPELRENARFVETKKDQKKAEQNDPPVEEKTAAEPRVDFVRCLVDEVSAVTKEPDGEPWFEIFCEDEGDMRPADQVRFKMRVELSEEGDAAYLPEVLRPGQTLHIFDFLARDEKQGLYAAAPETLFVVEPDYVMDITDAASCFTDAGVDFRLFFANQFFPSGYNARGFLGQIVGGLMEDYLNYRSDGLTPKQIANESMNDTIASMPFKTACQGPEAMKDLCKKLDGEPHLGTMQSFAESELPTKAALKTEPYFISTRYGLQGRIDLMTDRGNGKRMIVELKSGTPPYGDGVWPAHAAQVAGYELLLETAADPLPPEGFVLYSRAKPAYALRAMSKQNVGELKRGLLRARNCIAVKLKELADGSAAAYDLLTAPSFVPPFKKDLPAKITRVLKAAEDCPPLKDWYFESVSFLLRELAYNKLGGVRPDGDPTAGFAALWRDTLSAKLDNYSVIPGLRFQKFDQLDLLVELKDESGREHNFRSGDIVILYANDPQGEVEQQQLLKGKLEKLENDKVVLRLHNKQIGGAFFEKDCAWNLEHDFLESGYWRAIQGLFFFLENGPADLYFGKRAPRFREAPPENLPDSLNENQRAILSRALQAEDYFLVQGPPGSGKTSKMLTNIVARKLEETKEIIVVLAFTNRAVKQAKDKLKEQDIPFQEVSSGAFGKADLNETDPVASARLIREQIAGKRVFVGTISSFISRAELLKGVVGDLGTLILDEASQVTEPQVAGVLPWFKRWILIGDHKQLPPVVVQPPELAAAQSEALRAAQLEDFRQSLFERFFRMAEAKGWRDQATGTLETHYRMHRAIAALLPDCYGRPLQHAYERQEAPFDFWRGANDKWGPMLDGRRCVFVQSDHVPTSKRHPGEAKIVAEIAAAMHRRCLAMGLQFGPDTLGVITPWRAQVTEIRARLREAPDLPDAAENDIMIDTVERFQGAERMFIILSLAVHDPAQLVMMQAKDFQETEDRKLLVALSRAKEQVVVVGYDQALTEDPHYGALVAQLRAANAFITFGDYKYS